MCTKLVFWKVQSDCYCKKFRRDSALIRPLHYAKPVSDYTNRKSQVIYDTSHISFLRTQFPATLMVKILRTNSWQAASFFFFFLKYGLQRNSRTELLSGKTRPQRTSWLRCVECIWNPMAHGDAREGKWRGNWRMEWVASTLTLPRNVVYPVLLTLMRTPRLPVVDWTDAPADLNGLVRFAERRNLVSACVPSHFKRTIET